MINQLPTYDQRTGRHDELSTTQDYERVVRNNRLYMKVVYAICATQLWHRDVGRSHTTIRCTCNDIMDTWKKIGFKVYERYSQDKAHLEVNKLLRELDEREPDNNCGGDDTDGYLIGGLEWQG